MGWPIFRGENVFFRESTVVFLRHSWFSGKWGCAFEICRVSTIGDTSIFHCTHGDGRKVMIVSKLGVSDVSFVTSGRRRI